MTRKGMMPFECLNKRICHKPTAADDAIRSRRSVKVFQYRNGPVEFFVPPEQLPNLCRVLLVLSKQVRVVRVLWRVCHIFQSGVVALYAQGNSCIVCCLRFPVALSHSQTANCWFQSSPFELSVSV